MANYNSTANVILSINGKQAQQMLRNLEKDARRLEQQIAKAATAGDKATMKKLQRELNSTNKLIQQLQGSAATTDQVLRRLDKASPKELQKALRTLQQQLNGIQRGSKAWDAHVAKIQAVKAEIAKLNASLATQKTMWERMNTWLNNCQTALLGVIAAVSGLIMAGRKAVNAYAEMDEQLANTRKYTGMAAEQVEVLNEAFKRMDTRTPRAKLNELAQEAGRLGLNTLEAVQGYVEAADIINVALVDLGSGATQTIAKLTNIFGVQEMLGVKESMLAVGSTVNVLSQNCTASKPYLVEFAQRMAGIGSQAGLTIPQILAFGAVLDANGQKVEMSATAIQKVIMNLANKNQEFAKTLGLDAELLNATLKNSAKDGLLMFLQALHDIGEASDYENATMILAPAFKEMGLDAARVSQVLSTLAKHIDEVKWQMGEADKAFEQATSATREYEIFNNTAQAAIDKAKKRVNELAVELGQKLYPVMKHIYTSSGVFLRVLSQIVDFFIRYRVIILSVTASIVAYYTAIGLAYVKTAALHLLTKVAATVQAAYNGALALGKVAVIAFTQGLGAAKTAFQALNTTMKLNPFGLILSAITAVIVALKTLKGDTDGYTKAVNDAKAAASGFTQEAIKEQRELDILFGKLEGCTKGSAAFEEAKQTLINKYGQYMQGLINERGEITNLALAYDRLTKAIRRANAERGIQAAREALDQQYYQDQAQYLKALQANIEYWTGDTREAATLVAKVAESLTSGNALDSQTVARLNEISTYRTANGQGVLDNINSFINTSQLSSFFQTTLGWTGAQFTATHPADYVNALFNSRTKYEQGNAAIEGMLDGANPYRHQDTMALRMAVEGLQRIVDSGQAGNAYIPDKGTSGEYREVSLDEARRLLVEFSDEYAFRTGSATQNPTVTSTTPTGTPPPLTPPGGTDNSNVDKFAAEKDWRERAEAQARIDYATGRKNYLEYTKEMDRIAVEFHRQQLLHTDLTETERLTIQAQYYEAEKKQSEHVLAESVEKENDAYNLKVANAKQSYIDGEYNKATYDLALEQLEIEHQRNLVALYAEGSKERLEAEKRLSDLLIAEVERRQKETEALEQKYAKMKADYFGDNPQERQAKYDADFALLQVVYDRELAAAGDNAEEKLRIEEAFQAAKLALQKKYGLLAEEDTRNAMQRGIAASLEWLNGEGGKALTGTIDTLVSGMSAIFSQLSTLMQAELEIQTAAINKRYDAEISRAEGNSYQVKQLEAQKQKEIAKAKQEANRKMFAMQVIQAVAQTAQGAISAYSSAAAVPVVGWILAPIAAGMAIAAGAIQIAAIKKQQQASEAQGYSEGGFTPDGDKDKPVGIVHAGEWVASQKLTRNPKTRPLLEALDQAQRNNTIGYITAADVSRSITAPMALAASPAAMAQPNVIVNVPPQQGDNGIGETLAKLNDRLSQPIGAVVTVSGEQGIVRAQDEYDNLMRNKSPKSKK